MSAWVSELAEAKALKLIWKVPKEGNRGRVVPPWDQPRTELLGGAG